MLWEQSNGWLWLTTMRGSFTLYSDVSTADATGDFERLGSVSSLSPALKTGSGTLAYGEWVFETHDGGEWMSMCHPVNSWCLWLGKSSNGWVDLRDPRLGTKTIFSAEDHKDINQWGGH